MPDLSIPISVSDPASAIIVAAFDFGAAFCNYLSTPAGQVFSSQNNALVAMLWGKVGVHIPGEPPAPQNGVVVTKT